MPCRLNRLWHPPWLEVRTVPDRFHTFPYRFAIAVRSVSKRSEFLFEMDAQMASQSDLNWYKSFQKRSLKTTFAQGLQKGPIPTPLNLENRAPVQAPALFSLSQPCPKRCPKSSQKRSQGTPKSTRNSNKTVFNKEPQIDTDSLWCFWFPKKPKWSPRLPKRHQNKPKRDPKSGREPTPRKDSPRTFPKTHVGVFWGARRCLFC